MPLQGRCFSRLDVDDTQLPRSCGDPQGATEMVERTLAWVENHIPMRRHYDNFIGGKWVQQRCLHEDPEFSAQRADPLRPSLPSADATARTVLQPLGCR